MINDNSGGNYNDDYSKEIDYSDFMFTPVSVPYAAFDQKPTVIFSCFVKSDGWGDFFNGIDIFAAALKKDDVFKGYELHLIFMVPTDYLTEAEAKFASEKLNWLNEAEAETEEELKKQKIKKLNAVNVHFIEYTSEELILDAISKAYNEELSSLPLIFGNSVALFEISYPCLTLDKKYLKDLTTDFATWRNQRDESNERYERSIAINAMGERGAVSFQNIKLDGQKLKHGFRNDLEHRHMGFHKDHHGILLKPLCFNETIEDFKKSFTQLTPSFQKDLLNVLRETRELNITDLDELFCKFSFFPSHFRNFKTFYAYFTLAVQSEFAKESDNLIFFFKQPELLSSCQKVIQTMIENNTLNIQKIFFIYSNDNKVNIKRTWDIDPKKRHVVYFFMGKLSRHDHEKLYEITRFAGGTGTKTFEKILSTRAVPFLEVLVHDAFDFEALITLLENYKASPNIVQYFKSMQLDIKKIMEWKPEGDVTGLNLTSQELVDKVRPFLKNGLFNDWKEVLPHIQKNHNFYKVLPLIFKQTMQVANIYQKMGDKETLTVKDIDYLSYEDLRYLINNTSLSISMRDRLYTEISNLDPFKLMVLSMVTTKLTEAATKQFNKFRETHIPTIKTALSQGTMCITLAASLYLKSEPENYIMQGMADALLLSGLLITHEISRIKNYNRSSFWEGINLNEAGTSSLTKAADSYIKNEINTAKGP